MFTRIRCQNGTLKVKERKKGEKVWEFRFYEADTRGQRQRRAVTVGSLEDYPTESAARRSPSVQSILLRINSDPALALPVVAEFGAVIARYEQEEMPERYSTQAAYRSIITNYIRPRWGNVALKMVKPMAVEDWLRALKLAPKTRSHIRSLMHTIFQCAERWELTDSNPIKLVRVRGGTKRLDAPVVLSPAQFLKIAPLMAEPYRTAVIIAGSLGLRASEIFALRWSDFDFANFRLLVQRSVVHGRVDDVKTEYSRDWVPLDPALVEVLQQHQRRCYRTPEGWLFANPVTRRPYHQDCIQKNHLRPAGIKAGISEGIGWHTFRHSYRSWLDEIGAPMGVQKELMRHASIQTTMNIYGKAMTESKRQAHGKVVEMVLKPMKIRETPDLKTADQVIGS